MKKSLLGHLYTHIKGSAEDVATMSLQYLLTYYDSLRESFNDLLAAKLCCDIDNHISYECQSVGKDMERPDMSGTDLEGNEVILCEMKFYAGLTSNQPLAYLKRLKEKNGKGLVFICPKDRIISLWDTLLRKCKKENVIPIEEHCISVNGINMTVLSWEEVLLNLTQTANAKEKDSLADIDQLKGYCEQIVSDSFTPIREEELGAYEAKKYERLMYILDRVTDSLLADKDIKANTSGLKATPYRHGYIRYMRINDYSVDLRLDLETWLDDRYADTPYWVSFRDSSWHTPEWFLNCISGITASRKCIDKKGNFILAIDVPCGVFEDDVVESIKKQILKYLKLFERRSR